MRKKDPSALTVGELLRRLRLTQAWALLVVVATLIGGSFTLGMKISDIRASRAEQAVAAVADISPRMEFSRHI